MGTNYYVRYNICEKCGRYDKYHIGKSSGGWCFSLHVAPELEINDLEDVKKIMDQGEIYDEYGDQIDKNTMLKIITDRWKYQSIHGLKRHKINGWHCIGHGAKDYDLIIGEFS